MPRVDKWPFKDEKCSQTADVCIKIVSSYRWQFSHFSDP